MIKQVLSYALYCDGCNEQFTDDMFAIWCVDSDALDAAASYSWDVNREDEKHYCSMCCLDRQEDDENA